MMKPSGSSMHTRYDPKLKLRSMHSAKSATVTVTTSAPVWATRLFIYESSPSFVSLPVSTIGIKPLASDPRLP